MLLQILATTFLLQAASVSSDFLCSNTGDENGTALPALIVCRNATSLCDEVEACDGSSLSCPSNQFKPAGFVVRAAVSECDEEEVCPGDGAAVPEDTFKPAGTVIRPSTSTDDCDPAEVCTGVDASIAPDVNNCTLIAIDILGQSGKFSIFDNSVGRMDANAVTVEVDALRELDAEGNAVGTSGSVKHSLETFASQDFTIHPAESTQIGSVSATMISFDTPISSIGKLSVDTYILKNSGTIGTDTESWKVRANDVKFNIDLFDWKWCGDGSECKKGQNNQVGQFIDVLVKIKGKAATPEKNKDGNSSKSYDLGGDVDLELSDRVLVDGEWTAMPAGFPKMEVKGSAAIFTFRFPKFANNATYDPVVGFSSSLPTTSTTTTSDPGFISKAATGIQGRIIALVLVVPIALWALF